MPANHVLLQRIELNASAASVTFSNIPQTGYTDLKVVYSGRTANGFNQDWLQLRFNSNSSSYSSRRLGGTGSAVSSDSNTVGTTYGFAGTMVGATATSSTFSNGEIYIPNYTSSNNKSWSVDVVNEINATGSETITSLAVGLWANSAAVTQITLSTDSSSMIQQYSTFSLYGLADVNTTPAIAPKASGGSITTDGTYWIHTFNSTGAFVPALALTCDYLVVAGGGGAGCGLGYGSGGGGGAGGFRTGTSLNVTAQNYTITVGGGGVGGGTNTATPGTTGSNSVFSTITSSGGGGGGPIMSGDSLGDGKAGGSGGGAATVGVGGAGNAGGYTPVEGYAGGSWAAVGSHGSGGGGASAAGSPETSSAGGAGGSGTANSYSGSSVTYGGGGGGGASGSGTSGGAGGSGGGGRGANGATDNGVAGTANTGGGGGGARVGTAGAGGSGVVIIRYPMAN
jgi:hypothetical protein